MLAGAHHAIHDVASVADLEVVIRMRPIDVVVVDPQVPGVANLAALGTLFARYPAVPVIVYASVSAEGMHGSLALAAFGVRHVVLRGYDDQPAAFRATVDRARADTVSASLLEQLAAARARLPGPLDAAIGILFRAPHTVRGSAALARLAGMPPRTCSRALQRAGLASALVFVRAARVIRAYHYLRGGSDRVADVAARLGYGTPDALARDTRDVTGCQPSALVRTVGADALVAAVAKRLTRPPTTRDARDSARHTRPTPAQQTNDAGEPGGTATGEANPRGPPADRGPPSKSPHPLHYISWYDMFWHGVLTRALWQDSNGYPEDGVPVLPGVTRARGQGSPHVHGPHRAGKGQRDARHHRADRPRPQGHARAASIGN